MMVKLVLYSLNYLGLAMYVGIQKVMKIKLLQYISLEGFKELKFFIHLKSTLSILFLLSYGISFNNQLYAQVNVEQSRLDSKTGISGHIDGGLTLIRGNVNLSQIGLRSRLNYVTGVHRPFLQVAINYGEKNEVAFLNQAYGHARWTAMWHRLLGTELFAQVQEDSFRSLILRQLYGGGVRSELLDHPASSLALGIGAMYEREVYRDQRSTVNANGEMSQSRPIDRIENNLRLTHYLSAKQKVAWSTELLFGLTIYYQPLINQMKDYRLLCDFIVEIKLSNYLHLVESLGLLYDSEPPPQVQKTDLKSLSSLKVLF